MVGFASALQGGFYRHGKHAVVLLCGACAEKRGLWPADLVAALEPDDHLDCADCGQAVE
jgi:hypothetical protein